MKNGFAQPSFELAVENVEAERVIARAAAGLALSKEERAELMDLAKRLRAMADAIDAITKAKPKKAADVRGEPTFRFEAKVPLPENFVITQRLNEYAIAHGFTDVDVRKMFEEFTNYYRKSGKKWQDWGATWMTWARREKARRDAMPMNRVTSGGMDRW